MEISYWKSRWQKNNTGWHMPQVYPHLITYWRKLKLDSRSTVLVPLCGKSLDMHWLADQGHRVIGVDVSEIAIREFIEYSNQSFKQSTRGPFTVFTGDTIRLWVGDFLKLKARYLPVIDAIYDKAALIALPPDKREQYARHIRQLSSSNTRIFLNTLEYNQAEMNGPPFSVPRSELDALYGTTFDIQHLHEESVLEHMQKFQQRDLHSYLKEHLYLLLPKHITSRQ